jgi:hypothetical protein
MKAPPLEALWSHSLAGCKVSALSLLSVTLEHRVQASQIAQHPHFRYPFISKAEMRNAKPLNGLTRSGVATERRDMILSQDGGLRVITGRDDQLLVWDNISLKLHELIVKSRL